MDFRKPYRITYKTWWDGPSYTEGPVLDNLGNWYFTTLGGGTIMKGSAEMVPRIWASCTSPNGQAMLPSGNMVVCDSQESALKRFDAEGNLLGYEIDGICANEKVVTPNDVVVDNIGGLYFTDSIRHHGKVFYKPSDGKEYLLASELDYPNGLALSPDANRLFVTESYKNRVLVVDLKNDTPDSCRVFAELPSNRTGDVADNLPDGMAVDKWGNLWVAHYGMGALQVLDQYGKLIATVPTGIPLTSNLCFLEFNPLKVMVTGGAGEPGPGCVTILTIN